MSSEHSVDVLVIGGGAAGIAAAKAAADEGADTVLLEQGDKPGGVLDQCIHPGFGLHRYKEELTGPEFAHRLLQEVEDTSAEILTERFVREITPETRTVSVVGPDGLMTFHPRAVVLATGARERPFGSLLIPGPRPAGIVPAGLTQSLVNRYGVLPGKRAVILGSGDIGLIMARRLTLEGMEVAAVLELKPYAGGLVRNVIQCLDDFDIPLLLQHTVTAVSGHDRLESVTVAQVNQDGNPQPDTTQTIEADTLVLSVGLIPETTLVEGFVRQDALNGGPVVDSKMQTDLPWLFAAGNNVVVYDLVDSAAAVGEQAGQWAARMGAREDGRRRIPVKRGTNVGHLVPGVLDPEVHSKFSLRVTKPMNEVHVFANGEVVSTSPVARPSEMIEASVSREIWKKLVKQDQVEIEVKPA